MNACDPHQAQQRVLLCQISGEKSAQILTLMLTKEGIDVVVDHQPSSTCAPLAVRVPEGKLSQARKLISEFQSL